MGRGSRVPTGPCWLGTRWVLKFRPRFARTQQQFSMIGIAGHSKPPLSVIRRLARQGGVRHIDGLPISVTFIVPGPGQTHAPRATIRRIRWRCGSHRGTGYAVNPLKGPSLRRGLKGTVTRSDKANRGVRARWQCLRCGEVFRNRLLRDVHTVQAHLSSAGANRESVDECESAHCKRKRAVPRDDEVRAMRAQHKQPRFTRSIEAEENPFWSSLDELFFAGERQHGPHAAARESAREALGEELRAELRELLNHDATLHGPDRRSPALLDHTAAFAPDAVDACGHLPPSRGGQLPAGWRAIETARKTGPKAGQIIRAWISPEGQRFKSLCQAEDHARTQRPTAMARDPVGVMADAAGCCSCGGTKNADGSDLVAPCDDASTTTKSPFRGGRVPHGWRVIERVRTAGVYTGRTDRVWISIEGKRFNSLCRAEAHARAQHARRAAKPLPMEGANAASSTSAPPDGSCCCGAAVGGCSKATARAAVVASLKGAAQLRDTARTDLVEKGALSEIEHELRALVAHHRVVRSHAALRVTELCQQLVVETSYSGREQGK